MVPVAAPRPTCAEPVVLQAMEEMICKIEHADEMEQFTAPKGERRAKAEHFVRRMASALKEIFHHLFSVSQ